MHPGLGDKPLPTKETVNLLDLVYEIDISDAETIIIFDL